MPGMVVNTGQALHHQRHPRQRPEIGVEAIGPRTLPEHPLHLAEFSGIEFWFAARPSGSVEGANAAALPLFVPPAHALPAHLQLPRNRGQHQLASGKQAGGLFAAAFELLKIAARTDRRSHATSIADLALPVTIFYESVTVLCEIQ